MKYEVVTVFSNKHKNQHQELGYMGRTVLFKTTLLIARSSQNTEIIM